jgi:hypothetical protein
MVMQSVKQLFITFFGVLLVNVAVSQHSIESYNLSPIHDPILPLITNRVVDTIQNNWMVLKNEIDLRNSLKVFMVEADIDSIYCNKNADFSLSDLFAQPGNDWLLFVHGDSKTPIDAAVRGLEIQNLYAVKVIVFSWPSMLAKGNGIKNFKNSRANVEAGLFQFRELLLMVQKYKQSRIWPEGNKLSMLMHSLGNYYVEMAVRENLLEGIDKNLFDNLIINAASIEEEGHNIWLEELDISEKIYVISNKKDINLNGARVFTSMGKQLGVSPKMPMAKNTIYIDFTKAVGFKIPPGQSHTYFLGPVASKNPNIRQFYFSVFHGDQPNLTDTELFLPERTENEAKY